MSNAKCDMCHQYRGPTSTDENGLDWCEECAKLRDKHWFHFAPIRLNLDSAAHIEIRQLAKKYDRPIKWVATKALINGLAIFEEGETSQP